MEQAILETLEEVASFYDERIVGDQGPLGFRRSTELKTLLRCILCLEAKGIIPSKNLKFMDLGCADGRVNVFMSYISSISVGVELDEWTLDEFGPLLDGLKGLLCEKGLISPPRNIHLFLGDATDPRLESSVKESTGMCLADFDVFYTYLVMHEEFSGLIVEKARKGALFWVYGFDKIMPRYKGMRLLTEAEPLQGILAIYEKL